MEYIDATNSDKFRPSKIKFTDLRIKEFFRFNGVVYQKIHSYPLNTKIECVNVETGFAYTINNNVMVEPVDAIVIIK